jgi:N-hydroxyarylamine O-acetyltransferase
MTTTGEIDLDAYFRRIAYTGPRTPVLDTLRAIHLQHALSIPFENLDPLLRRIPRLDPASLEQKLVHARRGGYCFEQNLLLSHVLRSLGFKVTNLAARVMWNAPPGLARARTHMLLCVDLEDGRYVADVGFGGLTLTAPLHLAADIEQPTPHETFRLVAADGEFVMQALLQGAWKALYRFDLQPQLLPDYEISNWYVATHPESHFTFALIAARPGQRSRAALSNNRLTLYKADAPPEQRVLGSAEELRAVLQETFELTLADTPELDALLARFTAPRQA